MNAAVRTRKGAERPVPTALRLHGQEGEARLPGRPHRRASVSWRGEPREPIASWALRLRRGDQSGPGTPQRRRDRSCAPEVELHAPGARTAHARGRRRAASALSSANRSSSSSRLGPAGVNESSCSWRRMFCWWINAGLEMGTCSHLSGRRGVKMRSYSFGDPCRGAGSRRESAHQGRGWFRAHRGARRGARPRRESRDCRRQR